MSRIRMVVTDVDNTLVPWGSGAPDERTHRAVQACMQAGILVVIASGRPYSGVRGLFPELESRLGFITSGGARVAIGERELSLRPLSGPGQVRELVEIVRGTGLDWVAQGRSKVYFESSCSALTRGTVAGAGMESCEVPDVLLVDDVITLVTVMSDDPVSLSRSHDFDPFRQELSFEPAGGRNLDIGSLLVSKGEGVRVLQKKLGIAPQETAVFGDAGNDVSLFATTPNSYAVANALPWVKDKAGHVIAPAAEHGVVAYFESLV